MSDTTYIEAAPFTLDSLAQERIWLCWREESNDQGEATKVPYCPADPRRKASTTNPADWSTRKEAEAGAERLREATPDAMTGIGLIMGPVGDSTWSVGCTDLDTCIDPNENVTPWATECVERLKTHAEVSVNSCGIHQPFIYRTSLLPQIRRVVGWPDNQGSAKFKEAGAGGKHPPAIEVFLAGSLRHCQRCAFH